MPTFDYKCNGLTLQNIRIIQTYDINPFLHQPNHLFLTSKLLYDMPRPKSKQELIQLSNANFEKLIDYVKSLPKEKIHSRFPDQYLNQNVRDVLAHLHHWHLMMKEWHDIGCNGGKPIIPAEGYTWKTLPKLNKEINKMYSSTPLPDVIEMLNNSFLSIQKIISMHTEQELFEKKHYKWTGSTSLGAYLISSTSSHYDWALKLIKKALKNSK